MTTPLNAHILGRMEIRSPSSMSQLTAFMNRSPLPTVSKNSLPAKSESPKTTIRVWRNRGRFPPPVALGVRAVGWVEAEIEEWIRERIAERRGVPPQDPQEEGAHR